jgi:exopolysaccharide biosynthesis polyprenyl glycosylphosphotransferase
VPGPATNPLRETTLPALLLLGDAIVAFSGICLGYWLRYATPLGALGIDVWDARFSNYLPLLVLGAAFLIAAFIQQGLYDGRMLLRKQQSLNLLFRGTIFWLIAYLAFSLVIRFEPPISRLFVVLAAIATLLLLWIWRFAAYALFTRSGMLPRLQRRVAVLGWREDAEGLVREVSASPAHPFQFVGWISEPSSTPGSPLPRLGELDQLDEILERERIDVVIAAHLDFPPEKLREITATCERAYAEWKIIPAAFPIFLSGLRLQTIGSIPVIGVEDLAITRLLSRSAKRAIDIFGALLGLLASAPIIMILAALIKRESPDGPVLFRQVRVGAGHEPFTLYKLRSMHPNAHAADAQHQSTVKGDARLLRIGAWIRRWNLDELPQYWNVLRGDMSLVGPRPERPHHVEKLSEEIPHYLPRHLVKPGMTGWAQVNGLRGATSLADRIRYDIYYIENWSLWLDFQIIALTFLRWKSPA